MVIKSVSLVAVFSVLFAATFGNEAHGAVELEASTFETIEVAFQADPETRNAWVEAKAHESWREWYSDDSSSPSKSWHLAFDGLEYDDEGVFYSDGRGNRAKCADLEVNPNTGKATVTPTGHCELESLEKAVGNENITKQKRVRVQVRIKGKR